MAHWRAGKGWRGEGKGAGREILAAEERSLEPLVDCWEVAGGFKCIQVQVQNRSWVEAHAQCSAEGGGLLFVNDAAENVRLPPRPLPRASGRAAACSRLVLSDCVGGLWVWVGGCGSVGVGVAMGRRGCAGQVCGRASVGAGCCGR